MCIYIYIDRRTIERTSLQQLLQFYAGRPVGTRCILHETSHKGCVPPNVVHYEEIFVHHFKIWCMQTLSLTHICLFPSTGITRTNAMYLLHSVHFLMTMGLCEFCISAYIMSKLLARPKPWQSLAK